MDAATTHVVECFWPGVAADDLEALDRRAAASAATLDAEGTPVTYRGSWLLREDEVVLCFFDGSREAVTEAARRAEIPFERIHEGMHPSRTPELTFQPDQPDPGRPPATGCSHGG
jgi:hypothetical protein